MDKARAKLLSDFNEGEEREKNIVARIAGSTGDGDIQRHTEDSRIGKGDMAETLFDDNAAPSIEVSMDKRVGQTFTDRLVDRRVVDAIHLFVQCEGRLDIGRQA